VSTEEVAVVILVFVIGSSEHSEQHFWGGVFGNLTIPSKRWI